jgi:hypothetical protein
MIGVLGNEAVRPDDEQGVRERRGLQQPAHLALEAATVIGQIRGRLQLIAERGQHEVDRLDRALGLLASTCVSRNAVKWARAAC